MKEVLVSRIKDHALQPYTNFPLYKDPVIFYSMGQ